MRPKFSLDAVVERVCFTTVQDHKFLRQGQDQVLSCIRQRVYRCNPWVEVHSFCSSGIGTHYIYYTVLTLGFWTWIWFWICNVGFTASSTLLFTWLFAIFCWPPLCSHHDWNTDIRTTFWDQRSDKVWFLGYYLSITCTCTVCPQQLCNYLHVGLGSLIIRNIWQIVV